MPSALVSDNHGIVKPIDRCANYWSSQSGDGTAEFIGKCCLSSAVNSINSHADSSIWRHCNKALRELCEKALSLIHLDSDHPRGRELVTYNWATDFRNWQIVLKKSFWVTSEIF
jgi:hypothetical protein